MVRSTHDGILPGLVPGPQGDGTNDPVPEQKLAVRADVEGGRGGAMALNS